jgi:hypothetical protein
MPATYEKIATVTGNGSSQVLTFSSIPSTYTDLAIHGIGNFQNGDDLVYLLFNGSLGTQYNPYFYNDPFTAGPVGVFSPPYSWRQNQWGTTKVEFPNYRGATTKTWTSFNGSRASTSGRLIFGAGVWDSTSAITSIGISMYSGTSQWETGTSFTLYGITRA